MGRLSTTALNIVSPSTYFERTSAVNTTLPDDAVQLHHCLSVVHHRVDGLGQSQIFEFDLTWISGEEVSAQRYICILGNWGYKGQVLFLQIDLLGKLPKKFYF